MDSWATRKYWANLRRSYVEDFNSLAYVYGYEAALDKPPRFQPVLADIKRNPKLTATWHQGNKDACGDYGIKRPEQP